MRAATLSKIGLIAAGAILATGGATYGAYLWNRGAALPPPQEPIGTVVGAAFADGRLWAQTYTGELVALAPEANAPETIATPGKVVGLCKLEGGIAIAASDQDGQGWTISLRVADSWQKRASISGHGDTFVAFTCSGEQAAMVTSKRLVEIEKRTTRVTNLSEAIKPGLVSVTALGDDAAIWLGFNAGEWGGGLTRIARADGRVDRIESNHSGDLCGGPLNGECDPVHAIMPSPWNPICIVAAIRPQHMMSHGRIVEVCGKTVRRVYFKPLPPQPPHGTSDDGEPSRTVAFYGLARSGSALWSVGSDGLYRFSGDGPPTFQPMPAFRRIGGFHVSFANPEVALILTDVNMQAALSGAVPIMAVR